MLAVKLVNIINKADTPDKTIIGACGCPNSIPNLIEIVVKTTDNKLKKTMRYIYAIVVYI